MIEFARINQYILLVLSKEKKSMLKVSRYPAAHEVVMTLQ